MSKKKTKYVLTVPLDNVGKAALLSIPKTLPVQFEFGELSLTHQQIVKNIVLTPPLPPVHYLHREIRR